MLMQESWKDPALRQLVSTYSEMQKANSVGQGLMCRMRNSQRQAHLETGPCLSGLDLNRGHSFSPPSLRYTFHSTGRISHAANIHSKQTLPLNTGVERCMEGHHPSLLQPRLRYATLASSLCAITRLSELFFFFLFFLLLLLIFSPSLPLFLCLFLSLMEALKMPCCKAPVVSSAAVTAVLPLARSARWRWTPHTLERKLSLKAVLYLSSISIASGNDIVTLSLKLLFKACYCFTGNLKKRTRKVLGTLQPFPWFLSTARTELQ